MNPPRIERDDKAQERNRLVATRRSLMRVSQAAARLGVSKSWLDKSRLLGTGPKFVKIGRRVAYDEDDLDAWVESHKQVRTSWR